MTVLYLVLPLAMVVVAAAVAAFVWVVRSGQLDDVDTPPRRILLDELAPSGSDRVGARTAPPHAAPAGTAAATPSRHGVRYE